MQCPIQNNILLGWFNTVVFFSCTSSISSPSEAGGLSVSSSASHSTESSPDSEMSEFFGGRRLESLLQALGCEKQSGGVFWNFLQQSENMVRTFYILKS